MKTMSEKLQPQPHGPEIAEALGLVATMAQALPDEYAPLRLTYIYPQPTPNARTQRLPWCDIELGIAEPRLTVEQQVAADHTVLAGLQRYARSNDIIATHAKDQYLPQLQIAQPGLPRFMLYASVHTTKATPSASARRMRASALIAGTLDGVVKGIDAPVDYVTMSPSGNESVVSSGHATPDTLEALHTQFGDRISSVAARINNYNLGGEVCINIQNFWASTSDSYQLRFFTHDAATAQSWMASLPCAQVTDRLPQPKRWRALLPWARPL
jgi:hypothetical protein